MSETHLPAQIEGAIKRALADEYERGRRDAVAAIAAAVGSKPAQAVKRPYIGGEDWSQGEIAAMRALCAAGVAPKAAVAKINAEFGKNRTPGAFTAQRVKLGIPAARFAAASATIAGPFAQAEG